MKQQAKLIFYLDTKPSNDTRKIIKQDIENISIYDIEKNKVYYINFDENIRFLKDIFEDEQIEKFGYKLTNDYILLKQEEITIKNIKYDAEIATYILNPNDKITMDNIAMKYLEIDINSYIDEHCQSENVAQINLFETIDLEKKEEKSKYQASIYAYCIYQLSQVTLKKIEEIGAKNLFEQIDMKVVEILADMQYQGIYVDRNELVEYGNELKKQIEILTREIYELTEEEFNINSTKQLRRSSI